jgi:hypothetical protein
MFNNRLSFINLVAMSLLFCVSAWSESPPWIPEETILNFELTNPDDLFSFTLGKPIEKAVTSAPEFQALTGDAGFKEFQGVVKYLETILATDWKTALKTVFGGGGTLSVLPQNKIFLTVDSEDAELLKQLHDTIYGFAKSDAEEKGQYNRVKSKEYNGITGYSFGKNEAHCIIDNRFILSNKSEVLKSVIDNRSNSDAQSLTSHTNYKTALSKIDPEATLKAYLRMDLLKHAEGMQKALTRNLNPMLALLLAGLPDTLSNSNWVSAGLLVDEESLSLQAITDGTLDTSGPMSFIAAKNQTSAVLPPIQVKNQIASFSFYRDIYQFYSAKDDLFPERTSAIIFFENMMGIFFTGRDLTEEVWKEVKPEIRFVVSEQRYDPTIGTPEVQFPSFGIVFKLYNPEKFGIVVEEAWQKAIGLTNFTRGQQAEPGLLIDRPIYKEVKMTLTHFALSGDEDKSKLDIRFNFRPTLAVYKDNLILCSTDQLAQDLIDGLEIEQKSVIETVKDTHSFVQVNGDKLATILEANRDAIVRNEMVENGKTKEEVEAEQKTIGRILQYTKQASLTVGTLQKSTQATLKLDLNLPDAE